MVTRKHLGVTFPVLLWTSATNIHEDGTRLDGLYPLAVAADVDDDDDVDDADDDDKRQFRLYV